MKEILYFTKGELKFKDQTLIDPVIKLTNCRNLNPIMYGDEQVKAASHYYNIDIGEMVDGSFDGGYANLTEYITGDGNKDQEEFMKCAVLWITNNGLEILEETELT